MELVKLHLSVLYFFHCTSYNLFSVFHLQALFLYILHKRVVKNT